MKAGRGPAHVGQGRHSQMSAFKCPTAAPAPRFHFFPRNGERNQSALKSGAIGAVFYPGGLYPEGGSNPGGKGVAIDAPSGVKTPGQEWARGATAK